MDYNKQIKDYIDNIKTTRDELLSRIDNYYKENKELEDISDLLYLKFQKELDDFTDPFSGFTYLSLIDNDTNEPVFFDVESTSLVLKEVNIAKDYISKLLNKDSN